VFNSEAKSLAFQPGHLYHAQDFCIPFIRLASTRAQQVGRCIGNIAPGGDLFQDLGSLIEALLGI
jgi:hypothetical protein